MAIYVRIQPFLHALHTYMQMVLELRDTYKREKMSCDYRITQLKQLKQMLEDNQEMILDALWKDLHKVCNYQ